MAQQPPRNPLEMDREEAIARAKALDVSQEVRKAQIKPCLQKKGGKHRLTAAYSLGERPDLRKLEGRCICSAISSLRKKAIRPEK
jgi:hypothetical protein